jgi:hypothetical protein
VVDYWSILLLRRERERCCCCCCCCRLSLRKIAHPKRRQLWGRAARWFPSTADQDLTRDSRGCSRTRKIISEPTPYWELELYRATAVVCSIYWSRLPYLEIYVYMPV